MDYLYIILSSIFLLLIFITILFFHLKKKSVIRKIQSLTLTEKDSLLDTLGTPIGYQYDAHQDLFIARLDAPQKIFGYTTFYDLSAPYFNMIFDYETIYFDYNGRTWLIEMWKGQYGINTGCELGIYYADKLVSPEDYKNTHFKSVSEKDMLDISLELNRIPLHKSPYYTIGQEQNHHWWLTMFKMGLFSNPADLLVNTTIRFKDRYMLYSFLHSFEKALPYVPYKINNLTVHFSFFQKLKKGICVLSVLLYVSNIILSYFVLSCTTSYPYSFFNIDVNALPAPIIESSTFFPSANCSVAPCV